MWLKENVENNTKLATCYKPFPLIYCKILELWQSEYSHTLDRWRLLSTIVHFFSRVAYVWVRGAKTTGPIASFFRIGPVVFAPGTQTCATELKKWTIIIYMLKSLECMHRMQWRPGEILTYGSYINHSRAVSHTNYFARWKWGVSEEQGCFGFFTGAIDHAPQIFLRAFSGASAIAPVSWPSLQQGMGIAYYCYISGTSSMTLPNDLLSEIIAWLRPF
jgi:hypothetical protein